MVAKAHVESANDEKGDDNCNKDEVAHKIGITMSETRAAALVKLRAKYVKKPLTPEKRRARLWLKMCHGFDLSSLRKHVEWCNRMDRKFLLQFL